MDERCEEVYMCILFGWGIWWSRWALVEEGKEGDLSYINSKGVVGELCDSSTHRKCPLLVGHNLRKEVQRGSHLEGFEWGV